ncbi:MAG: hypothetical protein ACLFT1_06325 [Desulfonatronovibrio sp.]
MSIRQIAHDLYQLEKELSRLQKELNQAPADKFESVQKQINQTTLERNRLREMLDAKKKA